MKHTFKLFAALVTLAQLGCGQSPSQDASVNVAGKTISIKYSAPSVRGRQIFGDTGVVSHDKTYPVWRAGANRATAFHTDADLTIGGTNVPAGDYTLFVNVKDPDAWQLIINKQTGQWGLTYKEDQDLARIKMDMSKPASSVETLKYTLTNEASNNVTLTLAWDDHAGSVHIAVK